jgi:hypothetical protein
MSPDNPLTNGNRNIMKTENTNRTPVSALRPVLALTGAALCLSLASCVVPYTDGYQGSSATYTTYQPGYRITSLPRGYRSESISGRNYYYHNGHYYERNSGGYVVIAAPRQSRYYSDYSRFRQGGRPSAGTTVTTYQPGYRLSSLPRGYRSESIGGSTYYYHNGAYYQRNAGGYIVTDAPRQSRYYMEYTTYR